MNNAQTIELTYFQIKLKNRGNHVVKFTFESEAVEKINKNIEISDF